MCGIGGIFGTDAGLDSVAKQGIERMMKLQVHRGPDDEGLLCQDHMILGHRRLSIVDLSSMGRQPMRNEDGTVWVAHIGEIYNHTQLRAGLETRHRFRSLSDTEVLVHGYEEYGIEGLLQRLRGMFVFALYDARSDSPMLILARDRFGIKPLYYALVKNRLVFASEVRALAQSGLVPQEEDARAWLAFLMFGAVPTPWTVLKSARTLPPGHYLTTDSSGMRLGCYYALTRPFLWSMPAGTGQSENGDSTCDLQDSMRRNLQEAVSLHLMSDAPLGVFLSGGIDSSAVVALAARHQKNLVTLGIVFDEERFSEEVYQKTIAEKFRTQHHSVRITENDFHDELEQFLQAMDQPTTDGLNTYFVAQAARQVGLKVVLSGLGGDEIFCGYPTLRRAPTLRWLHRFPHFLHRFPMSLGVFRPALKKLAFLKQQGSMPFYLVQRGLFTPREAAKLLGAQEREAWEAIAALEPEDAPADPVVLQQFLDVRQYLVDQLLKDADVFGMAHSVEIRVPFLDHVLAETALNSPLEARLDSRWPKPLLTKSLHDLLPEEVVFRRKQGFNLPFEIWMRSNTDMLWDGVFGLHKGAYRSVWEGFISGRIPWYCAWAAVVLAHAKARFGC